MSEILAVSVHSGLDGGNMDNARSPKNRFRKQKNLDSKPLSQVLTRDYGFSNRLYPKMICSKIKCNRL